MHDWAEKQSKNKMVGGMDQIVTAVELARHSKIHNSTRRNHHQFSSFTSTNLALNGSSWLYHSTRSFLSQFQAEYLFWYFTISISVLLLFYVFFGSTIFFFYFVFFFSQQLYFFHWLYSFVKWVNWGKLKWRKKKWKKKIVHHNTPGCFVFFYSVEYSTLKT